MKFTTQIVALALVGLVSAPVAEAQSAKHGVQADQRIPEDTFLYFSFPSVNVMKERMQKSYSWGMWSDPAFDDFKAEIKNAVGGPFEDFSRELQENLGVTPMQLLEIPSGQVSIAVSDAGGNLGFIMFVDFGDSQEVVEGLLEKARAGMEAQGLEPSVEEYDGTEMVVIDLPGQENNPFASSMIYCIRDTEFVLCTNKELMKTALSNWDGSDSDTFTANDNWSYIKGRCSSGNDHGIVNWFVDPIGMFNTVAQSGAVPQAAIAASFLPTLGLDKLEGMGGVMDVGTGKYDAVSKTVFLCEQPSGILKVFTLKESELVPPAWVPSSVSVYSAMNWDVEGAYSSIETLIDSFSAPGTMAAQIDDLAQQGPGIHIKNDLIDQLTGTIQVIGDASDAPAVADPNVPAGAAALLSSKMAIALGCKDEAAMRSLLTKITDSPGFPGEVREFRDTTLIEIPNPQGGPTIGLGVTRGSMVFSTDISLLEQMVRGEADSPLVESDEYKKIAAEFPRRLMSMSYANQKVQMKSIYESFRKGDPADMFPGMGEMLENIDFTKLPEFEAFAKYLLPSGSFTVGDERGAFSQSFSLAP